MVTMTYIFLVFTAGKFVSIAYIPTINEKLSLDAHLKIEHVKKVCSNSAAICKSNDTNICAMRSLNGKNEYVDFKNACFLFIQNMCQHYGKEYSIISSGTCFQYFKSRRNNIKNNEKNKSTTTIKLNGTKVTMSKRILREDSKSTLYEVDTAFDYHICPFSCPNVYSPVCLGVNRGHGLYYKFFTFVNHCEGDLYYCKNWREFSPPPGEDELIRSSPLSWSFCAANRYIQFARFTEMTSAMGHYGWLAGDYRPTHIMKPHQRVPGFG